MSERKAFHIPLSGDHYEIGRKLGQIMLQVPGITEQFQTPAGSFSREDSRQAFKLFDEFCPGINGEIAGFAEVLGIPAERVLYYFLSYLKPGCSQMAVLPGKTANGHTLMARSYEFGDQVEDLTLFTTAAAGRYAHIGSSLMLFGRADGINECGLAVSQTSAGLPVGSLEFARKPRITGLQFWAAIRSILDNCRNVDEALYMAGQMPIAYNINLMLADKTGQAALLETHDGRQAIRRIDSSTASQFLCSTNHIHLEELKQFEPLSMRNSLVRYEWLTRQLTGSESIAAEDLKRMVSSRYPDGVVCHYYDEFFGTLRSMVYDVNEGIVQVCFGSPLLNPWHSFRITADALPAEYAEYQVVMEREMAEPGFYEMV